MSAHHSHHHSAALQGKKLILTMVLNGLITVAQGAVGLFIGSLSLLSDALHNFSDMFSLFISYIANQLCRRKCTVKQTFGFHRAEMVAALINAFTLLGIAILLCEEAINRLGQPQAIDSIWVVWLALASIVINGICVLLLKQEAADNVNMRSAYVHLFSDMLSSVAVLAGGLVMLFFHAYWIDNVLSILIAFYLVYASWGLIMQTLRVLMQFTPEHLCLKEIEKAILCFALIDNVHHVHIWQLNDKQVHFEAHLDFKQDVKLSEAAVLIHRIAAMLAKEFDISHTLLQPEIGVEDAKQLIVDDRL